MRSDQCHWKNLKLLEKPERYCSIIGWYSPDSFSPHRQANRYTSSQQASTTNMMQGVLSEVLSHSEDDSSWSLVDGHQSGERTGEVRVDQYSPLYPRKTFKNEETIVKTPQNSSILPDQGFLSCCAGEKQEGRTRIWSMPVQVSLLCHICCPGTPVVPNR